MRPTLRPYQERNKSALREAFRAHRSVLLTEPCGAGKGTEAADLVYSVNERGGSVLFLVNRRTLVHDMADRLGRLGIEHGVIMGDDKRNRPWLRTHVASIDTLHRREHVPQASLVIVDECRFAVSDTWEKTLDRFPKAKILGLDATPQRTDGRGLGAIFEAMVVGPSVIDLIGLGYLVPSLVFRGAEPNLSGVGKIGGEYNQKQLAEVCGGTSIIGDVVKTWQLRASDRKTVCFGVDQKHAREIAEGFTAAGVECTVVFDDTSDDEREQIWHNFDSGPLRVICSVGVVSYGWDHPICGCVIDAAPTCSVSRAIQRWGRGARPWPGKTHFVLLDHAGNTHRHGLYEDDRVWSLHGKALQAGDGEQDIGLYTCPKCRCQFRRSGNLTQCRFCGAPIVVKARKVEVIEGELEEVQWRQMLIDGVQENGVIGDAWRYLRAGQKTKEKKLRELMTTRIGKGYKEGWVKLRYHQEFHEWPSNVMMNNARAAVVSACEVDFGQEARA